MRYPSGTRRKPPIHRTSTPQTKDSFSNRGMTLEEDIQQTNQFYLETNKAVIHKKPTPIQIVNVHYPKRSAAVITEGYFQAKSTTDFNGVYRGKHIDFEAKETKNKTLFPLANIHEHQFNHMQSVIAQNGICFFIIRFARFDETYFVTADFVLSYWEQMKLNARKSIPYDAVQSDGYLIPFKYQTRVDYLHIVDQLYF